MSAPTGNIQRRLPIQAVDSANIQAAINKLLALAQEGEGLRAERQMLAEDIKMARGAISAHAGSRPVQAKGEKGDAFAARMNAWQSTMDELQGRLDNALGKMQHFDEVKWPRFLNEVDKAKLELEQAKREFQMKTEEAKQAEQAVQQLDTLSTKLSDMVQAQEQAERRSQNDSVRFERVARVEMPHAKARMDLPAFGVGEADGSAHLDEAAKARVLRAAQQLGAAGKMDTE